MRLKESLTLDEICKAFENLIVDHHGSLSKAVRNLSSVDAPEPHCILYALNERSLRKAMASQPVALIVTPKLAQTVSSKISTHQPVIIVSPLPELLSREIAQKFGPYPTPYIDWEVSANSPKVDPSAHIHPSAKIHPGAVVGPMAFIGPEVEVENKAIISAQAHIQSHSLIGKGTVIHPFVFVGHRSKIGAYCELMPHAVVGKEGFGYAQDQNFNHFRIPHTGRVCIEDNVHIGSHTCIDRGTFQDTHIGEGTKIDNLVHLAHNTIVGKNSLITANVTVAGSTTLGDRMMIGGSTTITGHIQLTNDTHLAGCTGVTKSITEPGAYGGFPAQPIQNFRKNQASFTVLADLRKTVSKLKKFLENEN